MKNSPKTFRFVGGKKETKRRRRRKGYIYRPRCYCYCCYYCCCYYYYLHNAKMGWKLNFHYKFYICHSLPACKHSRYFLVYRFLALFICVGGFVYLQPNCLPNFSRAHRNFPHVFAYTGRAYLFTINIVRLVHARNSLTTPPPSPEAAKKSRSSRSFGSRSGRGRRPFERLSSKETPREKERRKERKKREGMRLEARDDKSSVATCEYLNESASIEKEKEKERTRQIKEIDTR